MLKLVAEDFKPPERTFVFTASALDLYRNDKSRRFHEAILETIKNGKVNAVVTPLELAKLKKYVGEEKYYTTYLPVWKSHRSNVFCIKFDIRDKCSLDCYSQLYKLFMNHNLHLADLSSAIASIELTVPLITDDYHHWRVQRNLTKAYDNRHCKEIADCLARKEKRKYFEMYTSQDFCNFFI